MEADKEDREASKVKLGAMICKQLLCKCNPCSWFVFRL